MQRILFKLEISCKYISKKLNILHYHGSLWCNFWRMYNPYRKTLQFIKWLFTMLILIQGGHLTASQKCFAHFGKRDRLLTSPHTVHIWTHDTVDWSKALRNYPDHSRFWKCYLLFHIHSWRFMHYCCPIWLQFQQYCGNYCRCFWNCGLLCKVSWGIIKQSTNFIQFLFNVHSALILWPVTTLRSSIFCDIMLYIQLKICRHFRGICWFHLQ